MAANSRTYVPNRRLPFPWRSQFCTFLRIRDARKKTERHLNAPPIARLHNCPTSHLGFRHLLQLLAKAPLRLLICQIGSLQIRGTCKNRLKSSQFVWLHVRVLSLLCVFLSPSFQVGIGRTSIATATG